MAYSATPPLGEKNIWETNITSDPVSKVPLFKNGKSRIKNVVIESRIYLTSETVRNVIELVPKRDCFMVFGHDLDATIKVEGEIELGSTKIRNRVYEIQKTATGSSKRLHFLLRPKTNLEPDGS